MKRNDLYLVDGGLVNPVPVSVARNMGAEFVIAVDLHAIISLNAMCRGKETKKINGKFKMINRCKGDGKSRQSWKKQSTT